MKFSRKVFSVFTTILIAMLVGISSVSAQDDVVEVIKNSDDHTVFAELLAETELEDVLKQEGPYTVMAPNDDAFGEIDLETLKEDEQQLQNVVIGHLFQGEISAADAEKARPVNVVKGDLEASNGVVHVIDEVMME